ncbi:MAG: hypothetical protein MUE73_20765 [Planctomycetes bacterium]|jgi:hypothetical protein|nr:hypothetical protein [Planctomycetota bacterium]
MNPKSILLLSVGLVVAAVAYFAAVYPHLRRSEFRGGRAWSRPAALVVALLIFAVVALAALL